MSIKNAECSWTKPEQRPWRVRDKHTQDQYLFDTRGEAVLFLASCCTLDNEEWSRRWEQRLVLERNEKEK